jgi:hypothetical protein
LGFGEDPFPLLFRFCPLIQAVQRALTLRFASLTTDIYTLFCALGRRPVGE